jgi:hypothetical protein
MQQVRSDRAAGGFLFDWGESLRLCKCCGVLMIGHDASDCVENLKKLLAFHGFVPKTIPDVALSLGPMCDKCQKAWSKDLTSP